MQEYHSTKYQPINHYHFSLRKVTVSGNSWLSISLSRQLLLKQPSHFFIFLKILYRQSTIEIILTQHNHHKQGIIHNFLIRYHFRNLQCTHLLAHLTISPSKDLINLHLKSTKQGLVLLPKVILQNLLHQESFLTTILFI